VAQCNEVEKTEEWQKKDADGKRKDVDACPTRQASFTPLRPFAATCDGRLLMEPPLKTAVSDARCIKPLTSSMTGP
jgi:hypothetical protein